MGKKHNTANTSRDSFNILNNNGGRIRGKQRILEALRHCQPITSRRLSEITGMERCAVTRALFDLMHETPPLVKIAFEYPCPTTKRRVCYYALINWNPNDAPRD